VEVIVEADHLAPDVDQELPPEPLVFAGGGEGLELRAAAGKGGQRVAQGAAVGQLQAQVSGAEPRAVRRKGDDLDVHARSLECMDDEPQTCGKGVAANAALPTALSEVMAAIARNLETHMAALDPRDDTARLELEAYQKLIERHTALAAQLRETAEQMEGYRDLPMAEHDAQVMNGPAVRGAFQQLIDSEQAVATLLTQRLQTYREMLGAQGA
jgi:hypothetical protein